ncbi:hypothetical protein GGR56DRAFT_186669 [Xylariaceae sp. FL0804]|nr:hypothetical protein GGR56DRAFT_186669 [Xylariaceae sp. FL0804]
MRGEGYRASAHAVFSRRATTGSWPRVLGDEQKTPSQSSLAPSQWRLPPCYPTSPQENPEDPETRRGPQKEGPAIQPNLWDCEKDDRSTQDPHLPVHLRSTAQQRDPASRRRPLPASKTRTLGTWTRGAEVRFWSWQGSARLNNRLEAATSRLGFAVQIRTGTDSNSADSGGGQQSLRSGKLFAWPPSNLRRFCSGPGRKDSERRATTL